ncbi:MAG: DUF2996 domain-containing protein [Microcystaceae cyanobacterium]
MAEETKTAPKAPAKKQKKPTPEDKPFKEFMEQEFMPKLKDTLTNGGFSQIDLSFVEQPIPVKGVDTSKSYWQVVGKWADKQRQFNIYFMEEDIKKQKAFSYTVDGGQASTLESFMIDERKVTCALMVLYTLQRLNGQKWLTGN